VPERATVCGEPDASSGIESVPLARPLAVGAKFNWMVQLEPGATAVFEHASVAIANGAPAVAAPTLRVPVPEFVRTTAWLGDLDPTTWFPKVRLEAERETAGMTPLPLTLTVCGELDASSVKVSVALKVPTLAGEKPTWTVQVAPTARAAPEHEFATRLKEESPVTVAVETLTAVFPSFVNVTV
jgi:hypothetical protein